MSAARMLLKPLPLLYVALLTSICACGSSTKSGKGPVTAHEAARHVAEQDRQRCDRRGKREVTLDLNRDKQPDVWKLYAVRMEQGAKVEVLTCKERDLNFDGRKDTYSYYDDDGNLKLEEMDLDFDGRVDLMTVRRGGKVIRQEMDTNYDGRPDVWKYYEDEVLVRVERDSNYDNKVDYWEYYEGGQLDRIGYDANGDGRVDRWDRAPAASAAAAQEGTRGE